MPAVPSSSRNPTASGVPHLAPQGPHAGKPSLPLGRAFTLVGSRHRAHLHLLSRTVSKSHAAIVSTQTGVYIRDLASRERVYVNGKQVREALLSGGDVVKIGSFVFKFSDAAGLLPRSGRKVPPAFLHVDGSEMPIPIEGRTVVIGRRPTCDVPLMELSASTIHAIIFEINGKRYVRDLGSRTGTFVNGSPVQQRPLEQGDVIKVGETVMRYVTTAAAEAELDEFEPMGDVNVPIDLENEQPANDQAAAGGGDHTRVSDPEPSVAADDNHKDYKDAPIPLAGEDDLIPLAPADLGAAPASAASSTIDLNSEADAADGAASGASASQAPPDLLDESVGDNNRQLLVAADLLHEKMSGSGSFADVAANAEEGEGEEALPPIDLDWWPESADTAPAAPTADQAAHVAAVSVAETISAADELIPMAAHEEEPARVEEAAPVETHESTFTTHRDVIAEPSAEIDLAAGDDLLAPAEEIAVPEVSATGQIPVEQQTPVADLAPTAADAEQRTGELPLMQEGDSIEAPSIAEPAPQAIGVDEHDLIDEILTPESEPAPGASELVEATGSEKTPESFEALSISEADSEAVAADDNDSADVVSKPESAEIPWTPEPAAESNALEDTEFFEAPSTPETQLEGSAAGDSDLLDVVSTPASGEAQWNADALQEVNSAAAPENIEATSTLESAPQASEFEEHASLDSTPAEARPGPAPVQESPSIVRPDPLEAFAIAETAPDSAPDREFHFREAKWTDPASEPPATREHQAIQEVPVSDTMAGAVSEAEVDADEVFETSKQPPDADPSQEHQSSQTPAFSDAAPGFAPELEPSSLEALWAPEPQRVAINQHDLSDEISAVAAESQPVAVEGDQPLELLPTTEPTPESAQSLEPQISEAADAPTAEPALDAPEIESTRGLSDSVFGRAVEEFASPLGPLMEEPAAVNEPPAGADIATPPAASEEEGAANEITGHEHLTVFTSNAMDIADASASSVAMTTDVIDVAELSTPVGFTANAVDVVEPSVAVESATDVNEVAEPAAVEPPAQPEDQAAAAPDNELGAPPDFSALLEDDGLTGDPIVDSAAAFLAFETEAKKEGGWQSDMDFSDAATPVTIDASEAPASPARDTSDAEVTEPAGGMAAHTDSQPTATADIVSPIEPEPSNEITLEPLPENFGQPADADDTSIPTLEIPPAPLDETALEPLVPEEQPADFQSGFTPGVEIPEATVPEEEARAAEGLFTSSEVSISTHSDVEHPSSEGPFTFSESEEYTVASAPQPVEGPADVPAPYGESHSATESGAASTLNIAGSATQEPAGPMESQTGFTGFAETAVVAQEVLSAPQIPIGLPVAEIHHHWQEDADFSAGAVADVPQDTPGELLGLGAGEHPIETAEHDQAPQVEAPADEAAIETGDSVFTAAADVLEDPATAVSSPTDWPSEAAPPDIEAGAEAQALATAEVTTVAPDIGPDIAPAPDADSPPSATPELGSSPAQPTAVAPVQQSSPATMLDLMAGMNRDFASFMGGMPLQVAHSSMPGIAPAPVVMKQVTPVIQAPPTAAPIGQVRAELPPQKIIGVPPAVEPPELFQSQPGALDDLPDELEKIDDVTQVVGEKPAPRYTPRRPTAPTGPAGRPPMVVVPPPPARTHRAITAFDGLDIYDDDLSIVTELPTEPQVARGPTGAFDGLALDDDEIGEIDAFSLLPMPRADDPFVSGAVVSPAGEQPVQPTVPEEPAQEPAPALPTRAPQRPSRPPPPRQPDAISQPRVPEAPSQPSARPDEPPPRKKKRWKFFGLFLMVLSLGASAAVWQHWPNRWHAVGTIRFDGLEKLSPADQRAIIDAVTTDKLLTRAAQIARDHGTDPGYLNDHQAIEKLADSIRLEQNNTLLLTSEGYDRDAERVRLTALLTALYEANQNLVTDAETRKSRIDEIHKSLDAGQVELQNIQARAHLAAKRQAAQFSEVATAQALSQRQTAFDDAARKANELQASAEKLAAVQRVARPKIETDPQLMELAGQLKKADADLLAAQEPPDPAKAGAVLDAALNDYHRQIEAALTTIKGASPMASYLATALQACESLRGVEVDLMARQSADASDQAELARSRSQQNDGRLQAVFAADGQLVALQQSWSVKNRQANTAADANLPEEAARIRGEANAIGNQINQRKQMLAGSVQVANGPIPAEGSLIRRPARQMDFSRRFDEQLRLIVAAQPAREALSPEQRSATDDLSQKLQQVRSAGERLAQSLLPAPANPQALAATLKSQRDALQSRFDARGQQLLDESLKAMDADGAQLASAVTRRAAVGAARQLANAAQEALETAHSAHELALAALAELPASNMDLTTDNVRLAELAGQQPTLQRELDRLIAKSTVIPRMPPADAVRVEPLDPSPRKVSTAAVGAIGVMLFAACWMAGAAKSH